MRDYTVRDLCDKFSVGQHTVLGWIRNGDLLAVNVSRSLGSKKPRWRVSQEALEAFELLRSNRGNQQANAYRPRNGSRGPYERLV